ncbi:MAG: hypothetical protein ACKV2O_08705 [Acidimicrobiales bacterium]
MTDHPRDPIGHGPAPATQQPVVAAIDIGTQSVRLLISQGGRTLHRQATVTHLGRGVRQHGQFDVDTLRVTLDTLSGYAGLLRAHGVSRARAIATEGVRLARDPEVFLQPAAACLGLDIDLVDANEEGRLAFAGAAAGLRDHLGDRGQQSEDQDGLLVTVDLGGGSCEFAVGREQCEAVCSIPIGASVLTETYLHRDPPRPEELSAALSIAAVHLDDVSRALPQLGADSTLTFVGLGGTFTTMAAIEIGLEPYDRDRINRFRLDRAAAEDVFRTVVTEPLSARRHNPGLPESRTSTILGGSCAVVAIMRHFSLDAVVISDDDLLDGMVAALSDAAEVRGHYDAPSWR